MVTCFRLSLQSSKLVCNLRALPMVGNRIRTLSVYNKHGRTLSTAAMKKFSRDDWLPVEHHKHSKKDLDVVQTHVKPQDAKDKLAATGVKVVRLFFDVGSGYVFGPITESKLLRRIVFLETVAGIPGMVAGSLRHLKSLRRIEADRGWIQTLLDEAENERMHLLVFQEISQPGVIMRATVWASQLIAWNAFFWFYMFAPQCAHRFVGYIEEEAVHTYTDAINALKNGDLPNWTNMSCPPAGIEYWQLDKDAKMLDLLLAVRADEAKHRDVNHTLAGLNENDPSPFTESYKRKFPPTP